MSIYNNSLRPTVQSTTSDSPERWLERLKRLKRDTRLLEQVGTLPQSGRRMRAEGQDRWQVRLALLRQDPRLVERFTIFQRQLASLPRRARRWLMRKATLTLTAAALLLALSSAPLVYAAGSITVTTTDPTVAADGQCSLMEAIYNANADAAIHADCAAGSGADTIILPMGSTIRLTGTYNGDVYEYNGLPKITSQVTIEGNGSTIRADGNLSTLRVLMVELGDLTLNNTTISGGRIAPFSILIGAGILNMDGNVTLNHSTVSGNMVGGGIENKGQMMLNSSIVNGNTGGGIFNLYGTVTLNESTVSDNASFSGAGIVNLSTLILNNSTVSGNKLIDRAITDFVGVGDGAGIWTGFMSTVTLNNSTVSGNTISGTTLPDSYEFYAARGGGIFAMYGTVTLNNSTVTGNSVSSLGGGTLGISGGGIYMESGTLNLSHSLVSGNTAPDSGDEISAWTGHNYRAPATINGNDFNLIGHDGNAGTVDFTPSGSDIVPTQPLSAILGPLADNGGPTLTHALITGSPALDAVPTGPATDQRGVSRPQGPAFDIGAYELEQQALFSFSGFFQPVDNLPTLNTVKAGQGVPVKFSLSGNQGLEIFTEGYPVSQQVACVGGLPVDDIEQTVTTGGSSLSYDPANDTYTYVWKTNSSWKGQCRTLIVKLSDGTEHIANFKFK